MGKSERLKRFLNRRLVKCAVLLLLALLLFKGASILLYRMEIRGEFYASAVPGDPVHMGMSPRDVRLALGRPDDTYVEEDVSMVGLGGNEFEMRPTGQVFLRYWKPMLGQKAMLSYSYYKRTKQVENLMVYADGFAGLSEARAAAEEAADYAHTAFAKKGEYTCTLLGQSGYYFRAKRKDRVFNLEVIVHEDEPYTVNLYQSLW